MSTIDPAAMPKKAYRRTVGPRLKKLLYIVFALAAILGANSVYLASVTFQEWWTSRVYQDFFYQYMFLAHLGLGLLFIVPFLVFGTAHMLAAKNRRNRRAVAIGYALFAVGIVVLISGLLLTRAAGFELKQPIARSVVYWLHVICPLAAVWLYWLHRLAGPRIKWRIGLGVAGTVAVVVLAAAALRSQDPRQWNAKRSKEGVKYFEPSLAQTASGNFIPARALMNDQYCLKCHQDVYEGWFHSAHHFSSFNNPAYLASVRETREVAMRRDGNVKASRWCAGCHDPVPFFSGAFDKPDYDDINDPTAHAGITCTVCHAIVEVSSTKGNADYVIEEPIHYPFVYSEHWLLQRLNEQMVKAKPAFHKQEMLKPFHKTAEFCSTCHKVHLPKELTKYKDFLRGQNHYDSYLLSGVSGHGARSFYYPEHAVENCNKCHMPLENSSDFGAKDNPGKQGLTIHSHLFPGGNTALPWLRDEPEVVKAQQEFLDGVMRVDIFGLKEGGTIDGKLHAPLRPALPTLQPGNEYLLETVIRTLKLGHHFTQGTADSNEIWLDVTVRSGERVIGRSGAIDSRGEVDRWAHFVNVFMLDRNGDRINRRNAQDIFVPLYNHQIPPGAGQVAHYRLRLPEDLDAPVTIDVKLQYRKFDAEYMQIIADRAKAGDKPLRGKSGETYVNPLPITTLAEDSVTLPIEGGAKVENEPSSIPAWQRWNDYGIGLFLEGKAELRQAADAFAEVERLGRADGPMNLARVLFREGRIDEAAMAVERAADPDFDPPPPPWTLSWLSGLVNRQQGRLAEAQQNFQDVLEMDTEQTRRRGFDFSLDYMVNNLLGQTLFDRARQLRGETRRAEREAMLRQAVDVYQRTLAIDEENIDAHYNLQLLYARLGQEDKAEEHHRLHARYKTDDNAGDLALQAARRKYPAANHAAEALVIYPLHESDKRSTTNSNKP